MNFDNEFKKEIEAKAPLKVELKKIDNHIITNKPTNNSESVYQKVEDLLSIMVDFIPIEISLIDVLTKEIKDPLFKYKDKETGAIKVTMVPNTIYIVAIVYKLMQISKIQGWNIAKEDDFIYIYNGIYWIQCYKNELYKFFSQIVGTQRIWPARAFTLGHLTHNDLATVRI